MSDEINLPEGFREHFGLTGDYRRTEGSASSELDLDELRQIAERTPEQMDWDFYSVADERGSAGYTAVEVGDKEVKLQWLEGSGLTAHHMSTFDPPTVRALIARIETAEAVTVAQPCKLTHTPPFDFGQCETHDRTFPLGGTCDYAGKSVVEYLDEREREQRGRAVRAEMRAEAAERDRNANAAAWGEMQARAVAAEALLLEHRCGDQAESAYRRASAAEARAEAAESAVARVEALHRPMPVYDDECGDMECEREHVEINEDLYHADQIAYQACEACSDNAGETFPEHVEYPCATRRALDGADG